MEELLSTNGGTGVLIAAIAALVYATTYLVKSTGPEMIRAWYSERLKAEEFKRTREEAGRIAQAEMTGNMFNLIREDKEQDREERRQDRKLRERELELSEQQIKAIHDIARLVDRVVERLDRLDGKVQILAQQQAIQADNDRRFGSRLQAVEYHLERLSSNGNQRNDTPEGIR